MKNYLICITLLLLTINCYSQNLKKIKQSEVLFILHNGKNENYQTKSITQKHKDKRASIRYSFFFEEENYYSLQSEVMEFIYWHYLDFDEEDKNNPAPYFKVNQSFLRTNKDIIITREFMQKLGYAESVRLINKAQTIFFIDKSEILKKEIIIKEVLYSYEVIE